MAHRYDVRALAAVLVDDKSGRLRKLWQKWPDQDDPKKLGVIATWYEELDGKAGNDLCGKSLKPFAQDLLQRMLESDPSIVEAGGEDLLQRLWKGTHSIVMEQAA